MTILLGTPEYADFECGCCEDAAALLRGRCELLRCGLTPLRDLVKYFLRRVKINDRLRVAVNSGHPAGPLCCDLGSTFNSSGFDPRNAWCIMVLISPAFDIKALLIFVFHS